MRKRRTTAAISTAALLALGAAAACGTDQDQQTTAEPTVATQEGGSDSSSAADQPSDTTSTSGGGSSDAPTATDASTSGSATEELLLGQQVRIQQGGDGLHPSCRIDADTPDVFRSDPGVWLHNLYSPSSYPHISVLCLRGFSTGTPIDVEVSGDGFSFHTSVQPVDASPEADPNSLGYEEEGPETLFVDGGQLAVYTHDYGDYELEGPPGVMSSEMWEFLPPAPVREAIATTQAIRLTATQGGMTATGEQPVVTPTATAYYVAHVPSTMLVVEGFAVGAEVPVGVYRRSVDLSSATLVEEAGSVTMPRSRVATFPVGGDTFTGLPAGSYCLMPPLGGADGDCELISDYPPYPGPASPGDRGAVVERWQEILIAAGLISDIPANHDGYYGPGTRAVVDQLEQDKGGNVDGPGVLGPYLYGIITGVPPS